MKFFIPPAFLYSNIPDWTHEKQEAIKQTCTNVSILTIKPWIHFDIRYILNEGILTFGSFFKIEHMYKLIISSIKEEIANTPAKAP